MLALSKTNKFSTIGGGFTKNNKMRAGLCSKLGQSIHTMISFTVDMKYALVLGFASRGSCNQRVKVPS